MPKQSNAITKILAAFVFLLIHSNASAQEARVLLFEDDFERNETQELKDELGNGWGTNSASRAGGNKQVDLGDGSMHVYMHKTADHAVSVVHDANFKDCRIQMRFKLGHEKDNLGIDLADMKCKEVHAGHICKVFFRPTGIEILDFKNGRMKKSYRDANKAKTLTDAQKEKVKDFQKKIPTKIALNKWHDLVVTINGETLAVELNGKKAGSFTSPGMDHPQKDKIRFSASREFWMDDIKMFAINVSGDAPSQTTDKSDSAEVKHLYVAKLLLKRMEAVKLTDDQTASFNRLSADLRKRIDGMRARAGITKEIVQRRDEVYSQLKKSKVKGDELWSQLQKKANLTDAQRDVFKETQEQYGVFKKDAIKILTDEQRSQLPKGKRATK